MYSVISQILLPVYSWGKSKQTKIFIVINKIIFINVNGVQENIIFTNSNQFCNPKLELQWTINRKILKSKEIEYLKHTLLDYLLEKEIYLNSEHCSSIIISD